MTESDRFPLDYQMEPSVGRIWRNLDLVIHQQRCLSRFIGPPRATREALHQSSPRGICRVLLAQKLTALHYGWYLVLGLLDQLVKLLEGKQPNVNFLHCSAVANVEAYS